MITCMGWVPRGAARQRPIRFEMSVDEMEKLRRLAKAEEEGKDGLDDEEGDEDDEGEVEDEDDDNDNEEMGGSGKKKKGSKKEEPSSALAELPPELRMDEYDDDEVDATSFFSNAVGGRSMIDKKGHFENDEDDDEDDEDMEAENEDAEDDEEDEDDEEMEGDAVLGDDGAGGNEEEVFDMLQQGGKVFALDAESDDEDAEDDEIKDTDALLVVAVTEDEFSHLEVQLLSADGNLYVHHDISLADFPLCMAWLDCPPFQSEGTQKEVGNYMAVGTFNPAIEIWNLDVLDPLEPSATLGGENTKKSKGSKKGKNNYLPGSHEAEVMGLSWNKAYRQALASCSADKKVKVWDVTTQVCSHTFNHHKDKVQAVQWHPVEAWLLASGSFDRTVGLLDCRSGALAASYKVPADMESMQWNPYSPFHLYCSLEDGQVVCIDVRNTKEPIFQFAAHDQTTSCIGFSASVPGMLATASIDKTVRVWDVAGCVTEGKKGVSAPVMVAYKTMNVGKLFSLSFYNDDPFLLAAGGDQGIVAVWETDEQEAIKRHFGSRVVQSTNAAGVYQALGGANGNSDASLASSEANAGGSALKIGGVEEEDDSWMDAPEPSKTSKQSKGGKSKNNKKVVKSSKR